MKPVYSGEERVVIGLDNIVITDMGSPRPEESDEPRIKNQFLVPKKPPLLAVITGLVIYSRFSVLSRGPTRQDPPFLLPAKPTPFTVGSFILEAGFEDNRTNWSSSLLPEDFFSIKKAPRCRQTAVDFVLSRVSSLGFFPEIGLLCRNYIG